MNDTGMNTADITSVMAMMAPLISFIAFSVALRGPRPVFSILACTASITTMALSTTIPMASTRAKRVIRLREKPSRSMKKKVPTSDTGMAMMGMSVLRRSCRKM
jgi:hypothetical protein